MRFITQLKQSPIAIETHAANEQHYEVPARFYQLCLGKNLKYSSGYWPDDFNTLGQSEDVMLALTCERARLQDGQRVLELGCGWGSLSLFMAAKYPGSRVTAVSNSHSQKLYIDGQAKARGIQNLEIVTCDMNRFEAAPGEFDRVVSVEMFEHMRNYERLLKKIAAWMKPGALLFVHIFTHERFAYPFEVKDETDWMSKYFFTGGIMPSDDLLLYFQDDVHIVDHWRVNGMNYSRTSEAWLNRMDGNRVEILQLFAETYGTGQPSHEQRAAALKWFVYWRVFYMACAELWGYRGGNEWFVSHYLFDKP